jgi:TIR domain
MLDIHFEIDGRRVRAQDLGDAMEDMIFHALAQHLQETLAGVADPDTGEFPIVGVRGSDLSNLVFEISGSQRVVDLARERLGISSSKDERMSAVGAKPPRVFMCHASEDKSLARRIAEYFIKNGIETFFDAWEIRPGDSIRRKIDEGLEECTHFIVLATETSIEKEWVKTEIDGVYRRKIEGACRLVPLRHNLDARRLPASLGALHAPAINDLETDLPRLVEDIYGISRRPTLGQAPSTVLTNPKDELGISDAARVLVKMCMDKTEHGDSHDPHLDGDTIKMETGLSEDAIIDAIDELKALGFISHQLYIGSGQIGHVAPKAALFAKFDKYFNAWDPEKDGLAVAIALMNDVNGGDPQGIAEQFDWPARRMNPALTYLAERQLVEAREYLGTHPWRYGAIRKTAKTRRFVRDRS